MAVRPYTDMSIEILDATENPAAKTAVALAITMKSDNFHVPKPVTEKLCDKLLKAGHHSMFEHVSYTFLIQRVSRSFLAQITRQRTAKPTSGSQHYQDYSDYDLMVHPDLVGAEAMVNALDYSLTAYTTGIEAGIDKSEVRQVLPNACAVNYLWTIDARNLFYFLEQRLCNRNVYEMRIFANRTLALVTEHFPQLFNSCGPQCFTGKCFQELLSMQCNEKTWVPVS